MSELQKVGPNWVSAGAASPFTGGVSGAQRVGDAHGRFVHAALEGRIFILDSDAVTVDAANATKSATGTITLINGFWNPHGSGYYVAILRTVIGTTSGTPAGPLFYNALSTTSRVTSARTGVLRNALLQDVSGHEAIYPLVDVAVAVLPADTGAFKQIGLVGGTAAVAAGAGLYGYCDEVNGAIIVPPGCVFGLACVGAGTSHVNQTTLYMEVIPQLPAGR